VDFPTPERRACVVVPCFNEERRLDVSRFLAFLHQQRRVDLLLVDDGSRDGTLELLQRLRSANPRRIAALSWPANAGKAEAVRRGLLAALEAGFAYVGYLDADLAAPLETTLRLCEVLDRRPEIDVVVGVRLGLLGHRIERSRLRRLLAAVCGRLAAWTLGIPISDTQCGAKLFRASTGLTELLAEPFAVGWMFDVELLARYLTRGRANGGAGERGLYELPLESWGDVAGSKLRWTDPLRSALELARIWLRYRVGRARLPVGRSSAAGGAAPDSDTRRKAA
jgi:glycosyltransferase involved in cell wall biosynthesis